MLNKRKIVELDVSNKVVFLRLDLNVPIINGVITSKKRINAVLPTIKYLIDRNAKIVILSHLGRPKTLEDVKSKNFSLKLVAEEIAKNISMFTEEFIFIPENKGEFVEQKIKSLKPKSVLILENTRFNDVDENGNFVNLESGCDEELSKYWASLCDVFINDAYGAAHRKHASTYGIAKFQQNNGIGFLMNQELKQLTRIVQNPIAPFVVIFGGAKVSDKLKAVEFVLNKADKVIISGGMAYTFLAALGFNVGDSRIERDLLDLSRKLVNNYGDKIIISSDFLCATKFENIPPIYRTKEEGLSGLLGLDIGEKSIKEFSDVIKTANSVLWNGPMGVTEFSYYTNGTNAICNEIAKRTQLGAYTVIGGGDSAAAAEKLGKENSFSWISTGGGASLVLIEGSELIALEPIGESTITMNVVVEDKKILDSRYTDEFLESKAKKTTTPIEQTISFNEEKELLLKNNKDYDPSALPNNPFQQNKSIKSFMSEDSEERKILFDLGSSDPLAIYTADNLEIINEPKKKNKKVIQSKTTTKILLEKSGTTAEELERLRRLKQKGLSKAGKLLKQKIEAQKKELEEIEEIQKTDI